MQRDLPDFKAFHARQQAELGEEGALRLLDAGRAWDLAPTLRSGGSVIFPHTTLAVCGHQIADATGDWRDILRDYPGWRVFRSDLGRLYATRPGLTVYGWLTAQLRAEVQAAQVAALAR